MKITDKNIEIFSEAAANLIPAFAGLNGNLVIAAGGALIAPMVKNQISEMSHWALSYIQKRKVCVTANHMCSEIERIAKEGKKIRADDFFVYHYNSSLDMEESSASKLFEGMLLKAKEEYDSKKLPFLSSLTSSIFFAPNISESKAFVLLEILDKLSYLQLCALSIFNRRNILSAGKWESRLKGSANLQDYYDIAYEFISLKDYLLIEQYFPGGGMGIGDNKLSHYCSR